MTLEEVHAELPLAEEIGPWWLVAWRTAGAPRYGAPGARVECTCVNDELTDERRTNERTTNERRTDERTNDR